MPFAVFSCIGLLNLAASRSILGPIHQLLKGVYCVQSDLRGSRLDEEASAHTARLLKELGLKLIFASARLRSWFKSGRIVHCDGSLADGMGLTPLDASKR